MKTDRKKILEARKRLRSEYCGLFETVSGLLFRHDPIAINFETNTDEYALEVGTILPRLRDCASHEDALRVVHEEFVKWFDSDIAGTADRYEEISKEIWQCWLQFQQAEQVRAADTPPPP